MYPMLKQIKEEDSSELELSFEIKLNRITGEIKLLRYCLSVRN